MRRGEEKMLFLDIQNNSPLKRLYRHRDLVELGEAICEGEGINVDMEVSLLFCDDPFIQELNLQYRGKDEPTDVLSFQQERLEHEGLIVLGDIVISLETVQRFCNNDRAAMRDEIRLLFCHGLLHLLGCTHKKKSDREIMVSKQARYLGIEVDQAWHS